jgi:uncharacterized protein YbaP (TraB family)
LSNLSSIISKLIISISKDKQLFIAVGASHLAGQDGLLNQLRQSGFKISPIKAFK